MPPRIVVVGVVAFWLTTTGYIAYRDVWPRVFSSGPPPVSIELADEARQNVPARWTLKRNGQEVGKLRTQMKYHDTDDTFQFTYQYSNLKLEQADIALAVPSAESDVRITRAGELREQSMTGKITASYQGVEFLTGTIAIRGVVVNDTLTGRADFKSGLLNLAGDLDPVPVPKGRQPLNPLQPVNRLSGVHGGRDPWVVHESNPLQDAVRDLLKKKIAEVGLRLPDGPVKESLVARVGGEQQVLTNARGESASCWVIEYRRAEPVARTWVRATDGKVLRQEAFEKGESLSFERED
jgi:hypothetical protein